MSKIQLSSPSPNSRSKSVSKSIMGKSQTKVRSVSKFLRNGSKNSFEIPNSTRICPDRLQVYCSDLNHIVQARVSGEKFSSGDGLTCVDSGLRASLRVRSEVDSGCETPSHTPPSAEKSDSEQLQESGGKQTLYLESIMGWSYICLNTVVVMFFLLL